MNFFKRETDKALEIFRRTNDEDVAHDAAVGNELMPAQGSAARLRGGSELSRFCKALSPSCTGSMKVGM